MRNMEGTSFIWHNRARAYLLWQDSSTWQRHKIELSSDQTDKPVPPMEHQVSEEFPVLLVGQKPAKCQLQGASAFPAANFLWTRRVADLKALRDTEADNDSWFPQGSLPKT